MYLLLSVLASTAILLVFRWIPALGASTRHTILVSYVFSALAGSLAFGLPDALLSQPWFWAAALEGMAFYLVFRMIAITTQVNGVAVASIVTKLSVVIPVGVGFLYFGESAGVLKLLGMALGVLAIGLSAGVASGRGFWLWPVLAFVGSGCIDASFKLFQAWGVTENQFPPLITTIFGFAFLSALLHHVVCRDRKIAVSSLQAGCVLGLANFCTVYFLMLALAQPGWESTLVYAVNNLGVVATATFAALLFFGERPGRPVLFGLALSLIAIALLIVDSRLPFA